MGACQSGTVVWAGLCLIHHHHPHFTSAGVFVRSSQSAMVKTRMEGKTWLATAPARPPQRAPASRQTSRPRRQLAHDNTGTAGVRLDNEPTAVAHRTRGAGGHAGHAAGRRTEGTPSVRGSPRTTADLCATPRAAFASLRRRAAAPIVVAAPPRACTAPHHQVPLPLARRRRATRRSGTAPHHHHTPARRRVRRVDADVTREPRGRRVCVSSQVGPDGLAPQSRRWRHDARVSETSDLTRAAG